MNEMSLLGSTDSSQCSESFQGGSLNFSDQQEGDQRNSKWFWKMQEEGQKEVGIVQDQFSEGCGARYSLQSEL